MTAANRTAGLVVPALALVACVVPPFACSHDTGDDPLPLKTFELDAEVVPVWKDATAQQPDEKLDQPDVLDLYLDVSRPMGGFLPMRAGSASGFRTVVQWVPDHLLRAYGRSEVDLKVRSVGAGIGPPLEATVLQQLDRTLFDATSSRLDQVLAQVLGQLRSGRAEAAALVTDLVGTGESTGALAVSKHLTEWLESTDVRTCQLHLGLLGAKARYWGATHAQACPVRNGLGCRFSERQNRYVRLDGPAFVPFYVLVFGNSAAKVSDIGEAIRDDATGHGTEARWELLTAGCRTQRTRMTCTASTGEPATEQYALFREHDGRYRCTRDDTVRLACEFDGGVAPAQVAVVDDPPAFGARTAASRIDVTVDCAALRGGSDLPTLRLDIDGTVGEPDDLPAWEDWSTPTDEPPESVGKTLQLKYFIEDVRLRPDKHRIELPPLLVGTES